MYQLLKIGSSPLRRCSPVSLRSLSENNSLSASEKTCLLCKHLNVNSRIQLRKQSSVINPSLNKPKKIKQRRRLKSYTDIFVVTDKFSGLKRANVTKLSPTDLNLLTSTNVSLNELYKLKELTNKGLHQLTHTYSNLAIEGLATSNLNHLKDVQTYSDISEAPSVPSSSAISRDSENIDENDNINGLEFNRLGNVEHSLQPAIIEEVVEEPIEYEDMITDKQREIIHRKLLDQKHRDEIVAKTLAAYMEVCNYLKNPTRGLGALYFHKNRAKRDLQENFFGSMKSLNVYCTLLKGFANKGDHAKLLQVLNLMREENIEPNLQCYIAILDCLGRINVQNHYLKEIRIFIKEALKKNFTLDEMMSKGVFLNDEREFVLKAIAAYDSYYVPVYSKPNVWYNNHLVNHLNHETQRDFKLNESRNSGGLFTQQMMNGALQKQVKMEEEGYVIIKSIENKTTPSKEVLYFRTTLNNQYKEWEKAAHDAFLRDLATMSAQRSALNMEPYMRSIPAKDFIDIIVDEAKKMAHGSETYSPQVNMLYRDLGNKVYARYRILRKHKTGVLEKILKIHSNYCQEYASSHGKHSSLPETEHLMNPRVQWQWLEHSYINSGSTLKMDHQSWTPSTLSAIGKFLYHIIMHDLMIDVNSMRPNSKHKNFLPAFYTIFRTQGRMVKEEIKPHPVLSRLYRASQSEFLTFPSYEVPMYCPPIPWTSIDSGGYIISPCDVVRLPSQALTQKQRISETDPVKLYPSLDSLNQLGAVPWKVNAKVLDIILEVFRSGGSSKLDVPEPPSSLPPVPSSTSAMDKNEKYLLFKQKLQHRRKKAEMYSLWCDCLYRLSLANHFREDVFWLPHNMDFRGRVYPVPPHLNHLGSDLARSMLVFAEARPLGPHGLDWLKIHLINLTGLKKRDSVQDRLNFANDLIDLILDSADHPLDGKGWWTTSDEPWQTLACCLEIADVMRSGLDPAEYRSHFPVHQDGSCNGLQHYAALGRDSAGAFSVNLAPSDVPQDVYSAVVTLVEEERAKDEANGMEIAKILNGYIKRKVIKQTIMTTVYGVTRFGARLQIARQLKDIDSFLKDSVWAASSYLTTRTFESLRTMFTSTREIQDWFTECARLISSVGGQHVEWVTPMGLPIVQPYIKYKKLNMPSGYDTFSLDKYEKPNVLKQKNAFPPNFIHSLDSSHMMLTSLHCERAGITFVSVHDCYWTHPSTIDIMNKICREQFVALHKEPILEDLSMFFFDKYSYDDCDFTGDGSISDLSKKKLNRVLKQLPKTGDFDIKEVLNSIYFFS